MNIQSKLQLIQEGYTIDQINSGSVNLYHVIDDPAMDGITMMTESIIGGINSFSGMLHESENKQNAFKRFINWVIQKIRQLKKFITEMFRKKKEEVVKEKAKEVEEKEVDEPFVMKGTLEKIVKDPDGAIKILAELMEKFEDQIAEIADDAFKGYNETIKKGMHETEFKVLVWSRVTNIDGLRKNQDITENIIDRLLDGPKDVTIHDKEELKNIATFAGSFYSLSEEMNKALTYYEDRLVELKDFTDDSFEIVKLTCHAMLSVYPTVIRWVDRYLAHAFDQI